MNHQKNFFLPLEVLRPENLRREEIERKILDQNIIKSAYKIMDDDEIPAHVYLGNSQDYETPTKNAVVQDQELVKNETSVCKIKTGEIYDKKRNS